MQAVVRITDWDKKPKPFAMVLYESPVGVQRALRVLAGESGDQEVKGGFKLVPGLEASVLRGTYSPFVSLPILTNCCTET